MSTDNRSRLEQRLIDMGYNLDELERDNPYNQWMNEECLDVIPVATTTPTVVSERTAK